MPVLLWAICQDWLLTFGSHADAKVSDVYYMFIKTCKMYGVSRLEYFKEFFKTISCLHQAHRMKAHVTDDHRY